MEAGGGEVGGGGARSPAVSPGVSRSPGGVSPGHDTRSPGVSSGSPGGAVSLGRDAGHDDEIGDEHLVSPVNLRQSNDKLLLSNENCLIIGAY